MAALGDTQSAPLKLNWSRSLTPPSSAQFQQAAPNSKQCISRFVCFQRIIPLGFTCSVLVIILVCCRFIGSLRLQKTFKIIKVYLFLVSSAFKIHLYIIIQKKNNLNLEMFHLLFSGKAHSLRDSRDVFKELWVNCFLFLRVRRCWTGWNNLTSWRLWLWYGGHRGRCFWTWQYQGFGTTPSVGHGTWHVAFPHYTKEILLSITAALSKVGNIGFSRPIFLPNF